MEALESCLDQTRAPRAILLVDDTTHAAGQEAVRAASRLDERIQVIRNSGRGLVDALNTGLSHTHTPFMARMDADDVSLPSRFQLQEDFLDQHSNLVALGGLVRYVNEQGNELAPIPWTRLGFPLTPTEVVLTLAHTNAVFHPTAMVRTSAIKAVGGYRSSYPHIEDFDLWIRLQGLGDIANLDVSVLLYRRHDDQVGEQHGEVQRHQVTRLQSDIDAGLFRASPRPTTLSPIALVIGGDISSRWATQRVLEISEAAARPVSLHLRPQESWTPEEARSIFIAALRRGIVSPSVNSTQRAWDARDRLWAEGLPDSCPVVEVHLRRGLTEARGPSGWDLLEATGASVTQRDAGAGNSRFRTHQPPGARARVSRILDSLRPPRASLRLFHSPAQWIDQVTLNP